MHHHHFLFSNSHDVRSEDELTKTLTKQQSELDIMPPPDQNIKIYIKLTALYSSSDPNLSFWILVMYRTSVSGRASSMLSNSSCYQSESV